jgi:hypothetical protein
VAVTHDAASESHTGTSGAASVASFSWSHTPAGTPRGVVVYCFNTSASTDIFGVVTYGGVTMTAVPGGTAADTANEPGRCKAYALGSGIPTGTQTVVVNRTNNTNVTYATVVTAAAATATEITGVTVRENNQAGVELSIDDGSLTGTNSLRLAGAFYGGASPPPAGASSTLLTSIDLGALGCAVVRETTLGTGARDVGFASSNDDWAAVYLAIRETAYVQAVAESVAWVDAVDEDAAAPPASAGNVLFAPVG